MYMSPLKRAMFHYFRGRLADGRFIVAFPGFVFVRFRYWRIDNNDALNRVILVRSSLHLLYPDWSTPVGDLIRRHGYHDCGCGATRLNRQSLGCNAVFRIEVSHLANVV